MQAAAAGSQITMVLPLEVKVVVGPVQIQEINRLMVRLTQVVEAGVAGILETAIMAAAAVLG